MKSLTPLQRKNLSGILNSYPVVAIGYFEPTKAINLRALLAHYWANDYELPCDNLAIYHGNSYQLAKQTIEGATHALLWVEEQSGQP